jgi:cytosine/adenosine deaminase-related metal-dependent hydrolase
VAKGLLAIRSHVDTSDPSLLPVEALLEVKRRVAPYLDLQLVAFPQDGVLRSPGALDNLKRALALGVDVVGGIPHFERTMADGAASVQAAVRAGRRTRASWSTCTATRATTRSRATSRPWPSRPSAWACRAGSTART